MPRYSLTSGRPPGRHPNEQRDDQTEEVSALISYRASDDGIYVVGQNLRVENDLTRDLDNYSKWPDFLAFVAR